MRIAIPLFDRFTALDAIGPYEVLSRLPGARSRSWPSSPGPSAPTPGALAVTVDAALDDLRRPRRRRRARRPRHAGDARAGPLHAWVRAAHATTQWTTSVCTGSLILGAAGVLDGLEATTHWNAMDELAPLA